MRACKLALIVTLVSLPLRAQEAVPERLFVSLNAPQPTAQVRALAFTADGSRLCAGGLDKVVQVLPLPGVPGPRGALRWAVERGDYGVIYALAREGGGNVVAVAGKGWSGGMGEIAWFDLTTGKQIAYEGDGHRQVVASLASSADGAWLLSADVSGRVLARRGRQGPLVELQPAGPKLYPYLPVAIAGADWAVVPAPVGGEWELRLFDLKTLAAGPRPSRVLKGPLVNVCTAVAASADGSFVAAADATGKTCIWDLRAAGPPRVVSSPGLTPLTLAMHPQAPALLVAGQVANTADPRNHTGAFGVVNLTNGQLSRQDLPAPVLAAAFDPTGKTFAFATLRENAIRLCEFRPAFAVGELKPTLLSQGVELQSPGVVPVKLPGVDAPAAGIVVAAKGEPPRALTLERMELLPIALPAVTAPTSTLRPLGPGAAECNVAGQVYPLQWNAGLHGRLVQHAAVAFGGRSALAVATEFSQQIWLYELQPGRPPVPLRQFWGHAGLINGLTVAKVGANEYLISSAADGTTRVWPLASATDPDPVLRRWGTTVAIKDGKATIATLDPSGPLAARLVQSGDVIESLDWYDAGPSGPYTKFSEQRPNVIQERLASLPIGAQVTFHTSRGGAPRPVFQNVDAYQHLLAIYLRGDEWIAWHPSGYYACSTNGENLIGWQLNGPKKGDAPEFFVGEQFAQRFYQRELIRELLFQGTLVAAAKQLPENPAFAPQLAAAEPPLQLAEALPPKVEVTLPTQLSAAELANGIDVKVKVASRTNEPVQAVQLAVNGRPGPEVAVNQREAEVVVPLKRSAGDVMRLEALASTASTLGRSPPQTRRFPGAGAGAKRLHVLAVGVSAYQVEKLKLKFAHNDAGRVKEVFEQQFAKNEVRKDLFDEVDVHVLQNETATKERVLRELSDMIDRMSPRDSAVLFLAGHGFDDKERPPGLLLADNARGGALRPDCYLFAPVDCKEGKEFETCISDEEIGQMFWKAQGQVLIILDTCRSGAFQFGKALTTDVALRVGRAKFGIQVFAATDKGQDAHENPTGECGMLTEVMLAGLRGSAPDIDKDKVINTFELQAHLKSRLADESQKAIGKRQKFVSSQPPDFTDFPLTIAK